MEKTRSPLMTRYMDRKRDSKKQKHTCFDNFTAVADVQMGCDERNVGQVENLGAMWEGDGPEFRGGAQDVYEAAACARGHL